MDLRQLQTFVAIYESGGIPRAAERERTAPSVLSHHLANLEGQFPKPLFIRNPRGLLPTEYGERLHAPAVQILPAVQLAREDMPNMSGEIHGQVAIGMAYTALPGLVTPLLRPVPPPHPAVLRHHLANLEGQFPKPLFIRNPRGLLPTEYGERLHAHAVQILRAVQLAREDMHNMSGEIHGQVAIGMAYTALHGIGKQLMRTVLDDYPGLSLMVSETLSGSTITQLMEAHIDLALAYNPTQDARIKATALLEERMICIGKKEIIGEIGREHD